MAVLGKTGKNFGAGMSGGIAYVLDENRDLYKKLNKELILVSEVTEKADIEKLKSMITKHIQATNSEKAKRILADFEQYLPKFKKIIPRDYKTIVEEIALFEGRGLSRDEAKIEAFYSLTGKQ